MSFRQKRLSDMSNPLDVTQMFANNASVVTATSFYMLQRWSVDSFHCLNS